MDLFIKKIILFFQMLLAKKSNNEVVITKTNSKIIASKQQVKKEISKTQDSKKIESKQTSNLIKTEPSKIKNMDSISLQVLRKGSEGAQVEQWQLFLVGQGLLKVADGDFGQTTKEATIQFQKLQGLLADGVVGNSCYGKAMTLGFEVVQDNANDKTSAYWPPKPNFEAVYNDEKRFEMFGKFEYTSDEQGNIIVIGNWKEENIITIDVPQLKGIDMYGKPKATGSIYFHKKAAAQMQALWAEWEKAGLLHLVKTWNGTYSPRCIRGSQTKLSNHAFGTAFDINVKWNGLAKRPALVGEEGSVRELVEIANKLGFYWGGHFSRKDGMHFEIAKLL